jgi:hypothetical protein
MGKFYNRFLNPEEDTKNVFLIIWTDTLLKISHKLNLNDNLSFLDKADFS